MYGYLRNINKKYNPWIACLLTCIAYLTALSYLGLLSNGKYIIARSDLFQQYLPFIELLKRVAAGESSFWFSWNVNMGGSTALLHSYYTLSPFHILFFLLGEKHMMQACALVIVGKAGLAAFTCQVFLQKFLHQDGIRTVLFAMMYALCGFQVSYYFILTWMDALYLFPVIMLCVMRLVKTGKMGGLIASYAYLFFVNFYMGYIAGVCSFFLFIGYLVYSYGKKSLAAYGKVLLKYGACVLTAAALTCVIWFPALMELLYHPSEFADVFMGTGCNPLFIYNNLFMGQMQSLEGVSPFIYCGIPVLLLLPCYFGNRRIPRKERILAAAVILWFMLCMIVLPLNRALHAFDDPNMLRYRYAYCLSFVLVVIGCRESRFLKSVPVKVIGAAAAVNAAVYIVSAYAYKAVYERDFNVNTPFGFLVNFIFIALWIAAAGAYRKKKVDYTGFFVLASVLLMTELGVNAGMVMKRMEHTPMNEMAYQAWHDMTEDVIGRIKKEDDGWYRVHAEHMLCKNTGVWFDYQGISNFSSSPGSSGFEKGMRNLGFFSSDVVRCHAGNTPVTDLLLGIKYKVDLGKSVSYVTDSESRKVELPYETADRYLGPGFMVSEQIMDFQWEKSPFVSQNEILSAMTGTTVRCFEEVENTALTIDNGEFTENETGCIMQKGTEETDSAFHFTIPEKDGREAFAYFRQPVSKYHIGNAQIKTNSTENENIMVGLELNPARIVKLGTKDKEYALDMVLEEDTDSVSFIDAYFTYYNDGELDRAYKSLKESSLSSVEKKKNGLSGTVTVQNDKDILFTSIPYGEGWSVMVDHREEEIILLLEGAFIGVRLTPGTHTVDFIYEAPGVKEGAAVTLAVSFLLLIWICKALCLSYKEAIKTKKQ